MKGISLGKFDIEEFLKEDKNTDFKLTVTVTFLSLYEFLVQKGIMTKEEQKKINKRIKEYKTALIGLVIEKYEKDDGQL